MIHNLVERFKHLDRDVNALVYTLMVFFMIVVARAAWLIYSCKYEKFFALLPVAIPLLSAVLVARIANRLIINGHISLENERRQDMVLAMHHLIAVTQDLKAKIYFIEKVLMEGGRPVIALTQIMKTIEDRYESFFKKDVYKFLPGKCIDTVVGMSGDIFGIGVLVAGIQQSTEKHLEVMPAIENLSGDSFEDLQRKLQELLTEFFRLRDEIG